MTQRPILFVSDSPETSTGLARIARDLAVRVAATPEFRVGFLGKGGLGSSRFPFPIYTIPEDLRAPWGEATLHYAAEDFFRGERGIIFTIWDISRVGYIGMPDVLADDVPSKRFLRNRKFDLWGYFPVDCANAGGVLHRTFTEAYNHYDRCLFYTEFARDLGLRSGVRVRDVDWIPHGLEGFPQGEGLRDKARRRMESQIPRASVLVGCVGTNQPRKDWGLTFATSAWLKSKLDGAVHLWAHVDRDYIPGRWSLSSLARQFGLSKDVTITTTMTDDDLAAWYCACDVTIGNGLGEGFGYPLFESMACGTPVVHGDYAGGADVLAQCGWQRGLVAPVAYRIESEYCSVRPVFRPEDFGEKILEVVGTPPEDCRAMVEHLHWDKLWPSVWQKWFRRGLQ